MDMLLTILMSLCAWTGLTVQFLVAPTGEKVNPQNKIVAALAQLVVSDWTLRLGQHSSFVLYLVYCSLYGRVHIG